MVPARPAIDFTLSSLDGRSVTLSQLRGHPVVMEFWATWCGPCQYSTPSLEQIRRQFKDRGVEVLLINEGESASVVRRWAGKRFTATILLDQDGALGERYGLRGIPHLLVIDQVGEIQYDEEGYGGGLERNLRLILNELLATKAPPQHV